ncbi:MAG: hypothetical protein LBR27_00510 [Bifidobacteriaceae bacterium]|jgi:hypothetical protein|nr:hypothetical protein [Bifidobacteriaceae bacterium]
MHYWPRWHPEPLPQRIVVESPRTEALQPPARADHPVRRELVRVELDGVSTVVAVIRPDGPGAAPALVFGHGAGTGNHTAFDEHAAVLAARGIGCLVPDKDLARYSATQRDYGHMARQYRDLADWARTQPWAGQVGYYGESEGAWVMVPAAADDAAAACLVLVSAPVVTPREQGLYAVGTYLTEVGAPASLMDAGLRAVGTPMPFGTFPYADFRADHGALRLPVLMAYGTADLSMPVDQGAQQVRAEAAGPVTVLYYGEANHGLRTGEDQHLVPEFLRDVADWVLDPSVAPRVAGATPRQPFLAGPVPKTPRVQVQAALAMAGVTGVAAAVLRGRRPRPGNASVPYAIGLVGTVATVAAHAAYVVQVAKLATSYRKNPKLVRRGHRGLQALSLVTGGALGVAAARTRQPTWRGAVGGIGAGVLFLLAGYWGAFGREDRLS